MPTAIPTALKTKFFAGVDDASWTPMRSIILFLLTLTLCSHVLANPIAPEAIVVVDGDTIDVGPTRYRLVGFDTPEVATPRRKVGADERSVAIIASQRLSEILRTGSLDLAPVPCACSERKRLDGTCNFGRACAILSVNGKNVGEILIAEELAVPFICSSTRCPRMPNWPKILEQQMKGSSAH